MQIRNMAKEAIIANGGSIDDSTGQIKWPEGTKHQATVVRDSFRDRHFEYYWTLPDDQELMEDGTGRIFLSKVDVTTQGEMTFCKPFEDA